MMPSLGVPGVLVLLALALLVPGSRRLGSGHRHPAGRPADRARPVGRRTAGWSRSTPTKLGEAPDDRVGIRLRQIQCQTALRPIWLDPTALFPVPESFIPVVLEPGEADPAAPEGALVDWPSVESAVPGPAELRYSVRPSRFTRPLLLRIRSNGAVHPLAASPLRLARPARPLRLAHLV